MPAMKGATCRRKGTSHRGPVQRLVICVFFLSWVSFLVESGRGATPAPEVGEGGMVVAARPEVCSVGQAVLMEGGNAADAAVAVGFALAVAHPYAGNLGGGGFLLYRPAGGNPEAIDFREVAPAAARRDMFVGPDGEADEALSLWSPLAAGVPGTVAGLALLHERHGSLPWERLVDPSVKLARDGVVVDRFFAWLLENLGEHLRVDPLSSTIFLKDGDFLAPGDTLRQPELAETLQRIARDGPSDFYTGETSRLLVEYMERVGGLISAEDLRSYRPRIREPLRGRYKGYTLLAMPPPSSGGIAILQILHILEGFPLGDWGWGSSKAMHVTAEAMRHAFADRAAYLGDPDFVPVPVDGLLSPDYTDSLRHLIEDRLPGRASSVGPGRPAGRGRFLEAVGGEIGILPGEGDDTTHYDIVDARGNAVAVTTTVNAAFGSGIMVEKAGFLLNNEMDDFAARPGVPNFYGLVQGEANSIQPAKRPLSSMTPLMVLRPEAAGIGDGEDLHLVLGSRGGPRIITSVLQVVLNVITYGMGVQEAVNAPRLHHQWLPDTTYVEPRGWAAEAVDGLRTRGQNVAFWHDFMGTVHTILVDSTGVQFGAPDPRRGGCASGLTARPSPSGD